MVGTRSGAARPREQLDLACIAHKSLEICVVMQAVAAEFSGYAGKFRCFFWKESFEQFVSIHSF